MRDGFCPDGYFTSFFAFADDPDTAQVFLHRVEEQVYGFLAPKTVKQYGKQGGVSVSDGVASLPVSNPHEHEGDFGLGQGHSGPV